MFTTKKKIIPTFSYRSEAFDYMFAELVDKGRGMMEAAEEANKFADIVATNKKLPDAPLPEKSVLEKGISLLKQVASIKKEEPEIWDIATSALSGVIGGFTGGTVALEEPPKDSINFDELE